MVNCSLNPVVTIIAHPWIWFVRGVGMWRCVSVFLLSGLAMPATAEELTPWFGNAGQDAFQMETSGAYEARQGEADQTTPPDCTIVNCKPNQEFARLEKRSR